MRNISVLLTMLLFFIALPARTQEQQAEQPLQFSLNEARTYALNNSPVLLNSARDVEIARKKIWENTATGLPQASLNSSYAYTPELAGLSDQLGEFIPDFNPEDLKTSFLMTIQVNQLLFNGQYIVGLQAAKVYAGFSRLADTRSKIGILESITRLVVKDLCERELGVPVVATKNTFYLKPSDMEAWKILNCIKGAKTLEQFERLQQFEHDREGGGLGNGLTISN